MTDQLKDGGPAFPPAITTTAAGYVYHGFDGMTLRDWFAGQALAGIMSADDHTGDPRDIALVSYAVADAMIKARGQA